MNDFDHLNNILIPMWLASDDGKAGGASYGQPSIADVAYVIIVVALSLAVSKIVIRLLDNTGRTADRSENSQASNSKSSTAGNRGRVGRIKPISITK